LSRASYRKSGFVPKARHAAYVRYANYAGYAIYAGFTDFLPPEAFQ
jgi:hypothetical protein